MNFGDYFNNGPTPEELDNSNSKKVSPYTWWVLIGLISEIDAVEHRAYRIFNNSKSPRAEEKKVPFQIPTANNIYLND